MALLRSRGDRSAMGNLREQMRDMWGNGPGSKSTNGRQMPPVDIYEDGDELVLECEFPGMDREDIEVSFENNQLTISASRDDAAEQEERDYYRRERRREHLKRSFLLPNFVDPEEIEAEYSEGLIRVRLPGTRDEEAHRVEIQ